MSRPCERETRIHIGCRDEVAPAPIEIFFHGIEGHDVSRVRRFQVFWLSQYLSTIHLYDSSEMGNLLWKHPESSHILDETTDGGYGWTGEVSFGAKTKQGREDLVFSEIGMLFSNASDLSKNERVPYSFPFGFRGSFLFGKCVDLFSAFKEVFLPEKEGSSLGFWESLECGVQTMFFPEGKDSRSFQRLFGDHMPVS